MKELREEDIEQLLRELGDELAKKLKQPMQIMLIGGAYMILELHNRESTQDIDVYPLNFPDSTRPDKSTRNFLTAVRTVARAHGLSRE